MPCAIAFSDSSIVDSGADCSMVHQRVMKDATIAPHLQSLVGFAGNCTEATGWDCHWCCGSGGMQ